MLPLAGVSVPATLVLELALLIDDRDLDVKLRHAAAAEASVLGLDIPERETIIRALVDPPPGLEELRATLVQEHVGRLKDGLA